MSLALPLVRHLPYVQVQSQRSMRHACSVQESHGTPRCRSILKPHSSNTDTGHSRRTSHTDITHKHHTQSSHRQHTHKHCTQTSHRLLTHRRHTQAIHTIVSPSRDTVMACTNIPHKMPNACPPMHRIPSHTHSPCEGLGLFSRTTLER